MISDRKHIATFEPFGREPLIRRMADGSLICLFLTGGPCEPHNENVLKMSRSLDDGDTWSEPDTILSHSSRGIWATELFCEEDRCFAVVHTYNAVCHYRELETFVMETSDNGYHWSEPVSLPGHVNGVTLRQGFVMSNGEWFFPMYWQETTYDFDWINDHNKEKGNRFPFRSGCAISADKGLSYQAYGYLKEEYSLWEPNAVEAEPGHLIMYMRVTAPEARLERADSYDYGRTWTKPHLSEIPNPGTKFTLCKIDGTLVMINNFVGEKENWNQRSHLQIYKSKDSGASWQYVLSVEPEQDIWFYPHAYMDDKKRMMYLAYENAKEHCMRRIPYDDILK